MKLSYDGMLNVKSQTQRLFSLLSDVQFLMRSIPDVERSKALDDRSFEAVIKLKLSVVSSSIKMLIKIEEVTQDKVTLSAKGSGGGSSISLVISFWRSEGGIKWIAEAEVGGLISGLGSSILNTFARRKIDETIKSIQQVANVQSD